MAFPQSVSDPYRSNKPFIIIIIAYIAYFDYIAYIAFWLLASFQTDSPLGRTCCGKKKPAISFNF